MRLVALLLIAGTAFAQVPKVGQGPRALAWQSGPTPPWQPLDAVPSPVPAPAISDVQAHSAASAGPITVEISQDGTVEVWSGAAVRTLRIGLPGRPRKVWRDGGVALPAFGGPWRFPSSDPLAGGLGGLDWNASDFRRSLSGLLWVIEDGERVLTVIHPATAQVVYLPLPRGDAFDLVFEPNRLVLKADSGEEGRAHAWALSWLALLPQFARLGPSATPPVLGTALKPFPTGG